MRVKIHWKRDLNYFHPSLSAFAWSLKISVLESYKFFENHTSRVFLVFQFINPLYVRNVHLENSAARNLSFPKFKHNIAFGIQNFEK